MTPQTTISESVSSNIVKGWKTSGQTRSRRTQASVAFAIESFLKRVAVARRSNSDFTRLLTELAVLKLVEDNEAEGYLFRPSDHAYEKARGYLITAYRVMQKFPRPKIELDGERGYVLDWRVGHKIIRLACRGNSAQRSYIYYQSEDDYKALPASDRNLLKLLQWLVD